MNEIVHFNCQIIDKLWTTFSSFKKSGNQTFFLTVPIQSSQATLDLFKSSGTSDDESIFLEGQLTAPGPAASGPSASSGLVTNTNFIYMLFPTLHIIFHTCYHVQGYFGSGSSC